MNREFLMLAKTYDPSKHSIANHFASIKFDGQRAFWDGGVSRGKPKRDIPWANNNKDSRYQVPPIATGLWSRYGNVIHAPIYFLDTLPQGICLDGELYIGRGRFQETRSIVSKIIPDEVEWKKIEYILIDAPSPELVFTSGRINNPQFVEKQIVQEECMDLYKGIPEQRCMSFDDVDDFLVSNFTDSRAVQIQLPANEKEARVVLRDFLELEMERGGEGLILRSPQSYWFPKRIVDLLKVKPLLDAEAKVVGYKWGEEGKLLGMMGALTVRCVKAQDSRKRIVDTDATFNLSGFNDDERVMHWLDGPIAFQTGKLCPGETVKMDMYNKSFPLGSVVRFKYMGLSNDLVPREARYWRN